MAASLFCAAMNSKIEINEEHDVWTRIIELYKDQPHMWDKKHSQYFNREMKRQSFEMMFAIFCELDKDVSLSQFKKKLENMRTSFSRELKKVNASKQTASSSDEVYKPSLWYYDLLSFLEENSGPSPRGIYVLDYGGEVSQNSESNESTSDESSDQQDKSTLSLDLNYPSYYTSQSDKKRQICKLKETPVKQKRMSLQKTEEIFFDTSENVTAQTEYWEVIGKSIGLQLKNMSKHQQIIVQKLISDAIYYGKLEKLSEESSVSLRK